MTAKEKAKELVDKYLRIEDATLFYWNAYYDQRRVDDEVFTHAKKCALIAVDEVLNTDLYASEQWYWKNVLKEIEKL
jgi:hypothetical protein